MATIEVEIGSPPPDNTITVHRHWRLKAVASADGPNSTGATSGGQLDLQSLVIQSVGALIRSPLFISGQLPWSLGRQYPRVPQSGYAIFLYHRPPHKN